MYLIRDSKTKESVSIHTYPWDAKLALEIFLKTDLKKGIAKDLESAKKNYECLEIDYEKDKVELVDILN